MLNYLAPLISSFIQHGSCRYHITPRRQPLASAALERLGFDTNVDDLEHFTDAEDNFCYGRQNDTEIPPNDGGGGLFTSIGEPCPHCFDGKLEGEAGREESHAQRRSCHMRNCNNRVGCSNYNSNYGSNYDSSNNSNNTVETIGKDESIRPMQAVVANNGFCTRTNSVNVLRVGGVHNPLSCSSCSCALSLLGDSHVMVSAGAAAVARCHHNRHIQYQCTINSCTTRNCLSCTKAPGAEAQLKHHDHPRWPRSEIAASAVFSTSSLVTPSSCSPVRPAAVHQTPSSLFIGSSLIFPSPLQRLPGIEHRYCSSSSLKNEDTLIHSACEVKLKAGLLMLNSLLYPQNSQLVSAVKRLPLLNDPLPISEGWWWARRVEPALSGPRFNQCVGLERDGEARPPHSRSSFCDASLQAVTGRPCRDVDLVATNAMCEARAIEKVRPSGGLSLHESRSMVPTATVLDARPPNHQRRCSFCSRSVSVAGDRVSRAHDETGVLAKHGSETKARDDHHAAMHMFNTTGGLIADKERTKLATPRRCERKETLSMPSLYSDGLHTSAIVERSDVAGQRGIARGVDEVERQPLLFSCVTSASAALESASRGVHDTGGDYGGCNCAFGSSVRSVQSVSCICGGDAVTRVLEGAEDASSRAPSGRQVQNYSNFDAFLPNHCSNHHVSTRLLAAHIENKLCGLSQAPTSAESSVLPSLSSSRCFPPSPPPSPQSPSVRLGKIAVAGSLEASTTTALSDAAPICPHTSNPTSSINRDGGADGLINEAASTTTIASSSRSQLLRSPSKGLGGKRAGERSAVTQTQSPSTLLCPLPSAWAPRDAIPSLVGRTHPLDTTRVTSTAITSASTTTTTARISTISSGSVGGFFTASTSQHHQYLAHQYQKVRPSPSSPSPSSSSFPCNSSSPYPFSHRHLSLDEVRHVVPSQYLSLYAVDVPGVSLANYAHQLMVGMQCGMEVFVMALCLVERVSPLIPVCALSRHRVLLAATLVCAKSRDDYYLPMTFYAEVGGVSREDLAEMELALLGLLGFSVHVSAADYVTMLCSLRHHCEGLPRSYYNLAGRWQGILTSIPLPSVELLSRELLAELS